MALAICRRVVVYNNFTNNFTKQLFLLSHFNHQSTTSNINKRKIREYII